MSVSVLDVAGGVYTLHTGAKGEPDYITAEYQRKPGDMTAISIEVIAAPELFHTHYNDGVLRIATRPKAELWRRLPELDGGNGMVAIFEFAGYSESRQ